MRIGAHVSNVAPLQEAEARGADAVQMFLSNPQSWKKPISRSDAAELAASDVPIYAHSPYLVNVGSGNNRVRIPSRKILADTLDAAAAIGAAGVIVHGGHVEDDEDVSVGFDRWRKALDAVELAVPVLIENTAGGGNAIVREIENYGPLWEAIGGYEGIGVCLDTCHAWAAGEDLSSVVDRITDLTGGVQLVHCNSSRDPLGSNRDRHANFADGEIPVELLVAVVRSAGVDAIVETPADGQAEDIALLREQLGL